ncbi:hypothetical protein Q5H93_11810 [Hymenobacter sp. ASUV-10]|uniref:Uncharacterized protein n=1 Tax=Hymenobacter aranciens TaxID=3063996 RepID=A0ABT9BB10_9BACT|nr:hypothetical protein [Hymenobacter sp. ASUV-10]MDO7875418.1 hypothetical protein [Hymenobacter sp. ASUV-10]
MSRTRLFLLFSCLTALAACTPAPEWGPVAVPRQSPQGWSAAYAVTTDSVGDVYLAGQFDDTITFGQTRLVSAGLTDAFVAKWSPRRQRWCWAVRAGGDSHESALAVAVSRAGVFVAGNFSSYAADFGADTLANTVVEFPGTSHWHSDLFVARLAVDTVGARIAWARQAGGAGDESVRALAVRGADVYLAGTFASAALALGDTILCNARDSLSDGNEYDPLTHGFMAKWHDEGSWPRPCWARRLGGRFGGYATALAVQDSGVYVAGNFQGPGDDLGSAYLPNAGQTDMYVLKLHDTGRRSVIEWMRSAGGRDTEYATALVVQPGRVYVAGMFNSPAAEFGSHRLVNADTADLRTPYVTTLDYDGFIAALDDAGPATRFVWVQALGGSRTEAVTGLAVQGRQVYVAGHFRGPRLPLGRYVLRNPAQLATEEIFLARFTDYGPRSACTGLLQAGGPHDESTYALARHAGRLYLTGIARDSARFGEVRLRTDSTFGSSYLAEVITGK